MKRTVFILIVIAVVVVLLYLTFYTVNESSYVLVTQFGKPVSTQKEAGLRVKWPLQTIHRIDKRVQIYETALITYVTGDRQIVVLQTFACWRVADSLKFFTTVQTMEKAKLKLEDILIAALGAQIGSTEFSNLVSTEKDKVKIPEIERVVGEQINENTQQEYGIEVAHVGISRLALPEENVRSVWQKIRAERAAIANEQRAFGSEQSMKIKAEANKQKSDLLAEAYKKAEILKGEGEAQAAEIYASAYAQAPEFFKLLRTLDAYKKILKSKSTLVLSTDSDLLQYLDKRREEDKEEEKP